MTNTDNTKKEKNEIKRDDNIAEIASKYPDAIEVFTAFGLHCSTCFASAFDTLEQGAKLHGMIDEEIDEMLEEANRVINNDEDESKE